VTRPSTSSRSLPGPGRSWNDTTNPARPP
jgi:hypothetical protein